VFAPALGRTSGGRLTNAEPRRPSLESTPAATTIMPLSQPSACRPFQPHGGHKRARRAFTLVELLTVIVIIAILASLSLSGMAGARLRAKIDKTRSTIRKIDAVLRPMYESYLTRRVEAVAEAKDRTAAARLMLQAKRDLLLQEMPDSWPDVTDTPSFSTLPTYLAYKTGKTEEHGAAECLFMILSRSGYEPDALEVFRPDELGDVDNDRATEFIDAWGKPIVFLRWAPGWLPPASTLQSGDPDRQHDPFDPFRVDARAADRLLPEQSGYALVPLVASGGPDELIGITLCEDGWVARRPLKTLIQTTGAPPRLIGAPDPALPRAFRDNITNHDLEKK
jgi:prepilin-type N-terminal cleavage/methylation domain-containing protein